MGCTETLKAHVSPEIKLQAKVGRQAAAAARLRSSAYRAVLALGLPPHLRAMAAFALSTGLRSIKARLIVSNSRLPGETRDVGSPRRIWQDAAFRWLHEQSYKATNAFRPGAFVLMARAVSRSRSAVRASFRPPRLRDGNCADLIATWPAAVCLAGNGGLGDGENGAPICASGRGTSRGLRRCPEYSWHNPGAAAGTAKTARLVTIRKRRNFLVAGRLCN